MARAIIEQIRARFNEAAGSLRVITFLSPTCGPCRYGQGIVRALFEQFPDRKLAGYVVWVPMLTGDNARSAMREQSAVSDPRLHFWFDRDRAAARAWSSFIALPTPTWDVYAIHDELARWDDAAHPPAPRIWMHQLNDTSATRETDRLDVARLAREWLRLLGDDPTREVELAATLHAKGQSVAARDDSAKPSLDRVPRS